VNKIYRLIWNALTQTWVAVAEVARGRGKGDRPGVVVGAGHQAASGSGFGLPSLTPSLFVFTLALCFNPIHSAQAQTPPNSSLSSNALPTGGQVTAGTASISQTSNVLTVNQASQRAALDWQTFNIGASATVNFVQPNASAVALNRIVGNSASEIYGRLNANGSVFFSNPAGMLFAAGAQVNVGSLMATTLNISNSDFMAGNNNFTGGAGNTGVIRNEGLIQAVNSVALVGNNVQNAGQIIATTATLAAGNTVALDLTGDGLIRVRVTDASLQAAIENSGSITATQAVTMTAGQARAAINSVVNNSGTIRATGMVSRGGEIYLEGTKVKNTGLLEARTPAPNPATPNTPATPGSIMLMGNMENGSVEVGGTLDASAPVSGNGGFIETSAANVKVNEGAVVTTLAANGNTGTWLIDPVDFTISAGTDALSTSGIGASTLQTALAGNNVSIATSSTTSGNGDIFVNSAVSWSANNTLELRAHRNILVNDNITATGATAGLRLFYGFSNTSTAPAANTSYSIAAGKSITLSGSNPSLYLGNESYTVINSPGNSSNPVLNALQAMQNNLSGRYALGENIDLSTSSGWNSGAGFTPIGTSSSMFTGKFAGLGNTISNLTINRPTESGVNPDGVGLFGNLGGSAAISNLNLTNVSVVGTRRVGGLAGENRGTITNVSVSGNVSILNGIDNFLGGLVGINSDDDYTVPTITGSSSSANVTSPGAYNVGGLAGANWGGTISNSYATGSVSVTSSLRVGGLVSDNRGGTITNSYASGSVSGTSNVGGLVGESREGSSINNSFATGNVVGINFVGGLVANNSSAISTSFASGNVMANGFDEIASIAGGLVGANSSSISTSYATGSVSFSRTASSNNAYLGGLVGSSSGSVTDSFALGNVYGNWLGTNPTVGFSAAGGLVGSSNSTISNSFATGYVTANTFKGGVLGMNNTATVTNSYWNTDTSGIAAGTFYTAVSGTTSPTLGAGKTTAQLMTFSTMNNASTGLTNVDTGGSTSTWVMNTSNGVQYPWLRSSRFGAAGPQIVSGTISGIGTPSQITQGNLAVNGVYQGQAAIGVNGFYYGVLAPGTIGLNDDLLLWTDTVFNSTARQGGIVVQASGGNMTGLDGVANALTVRNNSSSAMDNAALISAKGSLNDSRGVIPYSVGNVQLGSLLTLGSNTANNAVTSLLIAGTGSGSVSLVDSGSNITTLAASMTGGGGLSFTDSNAFTVGTVGSTSGITTAGGSVSLTATGASSDLTIAQAVTTTGDGGTVTLNAGRNISINNTVTVNGTAGVSLLYGGSGDYDFGLSALGFSGKINFAGTGGFTTQKADNNAITYTVIKTLGSAGSTTGTDLQGMALTGNNYALGNNIDASATSGWSAGFNPIGTSANPFTGKFSGLGNTISNLRINRPTTDHVGLFGYIASGSSVSNVALSGGTIQGSNNVGVVVGNNNYGEVSNVISSATVLGSYAVGGVVGSNAGTLANSFTTGSTSGVGGSGAIGGLVGINYGNISNSNASGTTHGGFTSGLSDGDSVGGLVGGNYSNIANSWVSGGSVTGRTNVGGIVGYSGGSGTQTNNRYNIDAVAINGQTGTYVTRGGLYGTQFASWLPTKSLSLNAYSQNGGSLALVGGTRGNSNAVYGINSVQGFKDLLGFADGGYSFELTGNIDLASAPNLHIPYLVGNLDGNGYNISNLRINQRFSDSLGLVGILAGGNAQDSILSNIALLDSLVVGGSNLGALVGYNKPNTNSYTNAQVSNSYATGRVEGSSAVGGLIGTNEGRLENSYSLVKTQGVDYVGGLVGINSGSNALITKSYTAGETTATNTTAGGIAGGTNGGTINSSVFWNKDVSPLAGRVGTDTTPSLAGGLTSAQMRDASNMTALGFTTTPGGAPEGGSQWVIVNGDGTLNNSGTNGGGTLPMLASEWSAKINNAHQLQLIALDPGYLLPGNYSGSYTLGGNIDASKTGNGTDVWGSKGFVPLGTSSSPFSVEFNGADANGQNNTISNLTINRPGQDKVGLFGFIGPNQFTGVVRNLNLSNVSVAGRSYVGGLAGYNQGSIENVSVSGSVLAQGDTQGSAYAGGLVGKNVFTISDSSSSANVSSPDGSYLGGLVGENTRIVSNTYATGNVTGGVAGFGASFVGGLVGRNLGNGTTSNSSSIDNSYASGNVTGWENVGGLVGWHEGSIANTYALGAVTGTTAVGGLVGRIHSTSSTLASTSITTSYAAGAVSGPAGLTGGLVAAISADLDLNSISITNSHWNKETTRQATSFGQGAGVTGLTSEQMRDASQLTFSFTTTPGGSGWVIVNGDGSLNDRTYRDNNNDIAPNPDNTANGGGTMPMLASEWSANIKNAHQLQLMTLSREYSYSLSNNIDATKTGNSSDVWGSKGFIPVGDKGDPTYNADTNPSVRAPNPFAGGLNGNNNAISNLTINRAGSRAQSDYVGLFGSVNSEGNISNLNLINSTISGQHNVGALAGEAYGSITNVNVMGGTVSASGNSTGGLVGLSGASIDKSSSGASVSSDGVFVGGLVGWAIGGNISNSYSNASSVNGAGNVGGLVGYNGGNSTISNSYATGSVNATANFSATGTGGLVGRNDGNITTSYASAYVPSNAQGRGGLVGFDQTDDSAISVTNSYWNIDTSGQTSSGGGTGRTSLNMQNALNFAGFSFTTTPGGTGWVIVNGDGTLNDRTINGLTGTNGGGTMPMLASEWSANINNAHQLQLMALNRSANYTLARHIDANGTSLGGGGDVWLGGTNSGFVPVGNDASRFNGTLNGQGNQIENLYINRPGKSQVGLFGVTGVNAAISNVGITRDFSTGSIVGGNDVGALAGVNYGSIYNSYASVDVVGNVNVGGLVGTNNGAIANSYAVSSVSGNSVVGGLVGENSGSLADTYAISALSTNAGTVGGLVGRNASGGSINTSYASSGFAGTQTNKGGLVGINESGAIMRNSYWNTDGSSSAADPGSSGQSISNTPLSPTNMRNANSFANFKLTSTPGGTGWVLVNGNGYINCLTGDNQCVTDTTGAMPMLATEWSTTINNAHQLQLMALDRNASYTLGRDNINATATGSQTDVWDSAGFVPVGNSMNPFNGSLNGAGQRRNIESLFINRPGRDDVGLFGTVGPGALIYSVRLGSPNVTGKNNVGALVGTNMGALIDNGVAGPYTGNNFTSKGEENVGGLVGYNQGVINASGNSSVKVTGNQYVGGLVGYNDEAGRIYNADSQFSNIQGLGSTASDLGGLVGFNDGEGVIRNSFYNIETVSFSSSLTVPNGGFATGNYATRGGIYNSQYQDWLGNGKSLNITNYATNLSLANGTYNISSVQSFKDMLGFADANLSFKLTDNLNFNSENGGSNLHIPYFYGSLDGNGKTISNLNINQPFSRNVGLVGRFDGEGSISNLKLTNVNVTGSINVGALVGVNNDGTVSESSAQGAVRGKASVGGLVGANGYLIEKSYADVTVTGLGPTDDSNYGNSQIGGLVGFNSSDSFIRESFAVGTVSGTFQVGGLAGWNDGSIANTYSSGTVNGGFEVGGLVGRNTGPVSNSYTESSVIGTGNRIGRLVGYLAGDEGNITNTFYNSSVTATQPGSYPVGGFGDKGGQAEDDPEPPGLDSTQIKQFASFDSADWSIADEGGSSNIWRIYEGSTAPLLRTFLTPLNVTANATRDYNGSPSFTGVASLTPSIANATVLVSSSPLPTYSVSGNNLGTYGNVGSYTLTPTGGIYSTQLGGYDISFLPGTLTINQLASVVYTGLSTNNKKSWSDAANWAGGAVPFGSNVAQVVIPAATSLPANSSALDFDSEGFFSTLSSLTVGAGSRLNVLSGVLRVNGDVNANAAILRAGSSYGYGKLVVVNGSLTASDFDVTNNGFNANFNSTLNDSENAENGVSKLTNLNLGYLGGDLLLDSNPMVASNSITLNVSGNLQQGSPLTGNALSAPTISLTTGTGMGTGTTSPLTPTSPLRIATNNLTASTTSGDIWLVNTPLASSAVTLNGLSNASNGVTYYSQIGQALNIASNITSAGGAITIDPPSSIAMAAGTSINSGGGAIDLQASGAMTLTNVNAGSGSINLTSLNGGSITANSFTATGGITGAPYTVNNPTSSTNTGTTSSATSQAITVAIQSVLPTTSTNTATTSTTGTSSTSSSTSGGSGSSGSGSGSGSGAGSGGSAGSGGGSGGGTGSNSNDKKNEPAPVVIKTVSVAGSTVVKPADQIVTPVKTRGNALSCRRVG
jgi:filamentous hemagglutinin family protein